MSRYINPFIEQDLKKKMVFVGGPRQVGKTTAAKWIAQHTFNDFVYFNWDSDEDRLRMQKKQWPTEMPLIIFDELHKYPRWKQWIKGVYDKREEQQQYLVTGSARMNVYKRGGDSLLGRYHYWRLHPFTLDEHPIGITPQEAFDRLMHLGGFPEPFFHNDEREVKRWRSERMNKLLREDVRDISRVHEIHLLGLFIDALRERVSSQIVHANLAQDLQLSPTTTRSWLTLIEHLYIGFSVKPLTKNIPRAIHKPPKVYFYDNGDTLGGKGARLENLVATHLLKRLHFREDYYGERCELHYIRDRSGREVDFVTVIDGEVDTLIEVKLSDDSIPAGLTYYAKRLNPKQTILLVGNNTQPYDKNGIHITNPIDYFNKGPWDIAGTEEK